MSLGVGWYFGLDGSLVAAFTAGLVFLVLCFGALAGALAVEFGLARVVNSRFDGAAATWRQIGSAWWHEATTAPMLFCWRQPFRTYAIPDNLMFVPNKPGQQGVIFVHGLFCNRAFWTPWMTRLQATGHVFEAINLEPVFGSIDDYQQSIDQAVRRVTAATGTAPLLVCHSMGGLAVRAWLAAQGANVTAYRVITIGTPHRGTWLARWGHSTNARQMQPGSDWLARLNEAQAAPPTHRFTCWYSTSDNIVFPSSSATLPGADNRALNGVAHVQMAFLPQVIDDTLAMLETRSA